MVSPSRNESVLGDQLSATLRSLGIHERPISGGNHLAIVADRFFDNIERLNAGRIPGGTLSISERDNLLASINNLNRFDAAQNLTARSISARKDDGGSMELVLVSEHADENEFTFAREVQAAEVGHRYDFIIFLNGIPYIHIELKGRGVGTTSALEQFGRYNKNPPGGLFNFTLLLVASDDTQTEYIINNAVRGVRDVARWANHENKKYLKLDAFAESFLSPSFMQEYFRYGILVSPDEKKVYALRPYQYHALVSAIRKMERSLTSTNEDNSLNSWAFHSPGAGKTMTGYAVARQAASKKDRNGDSHYRKVFVVSDRIAIDEQWTTEHSRFTIDGVGAARPESSTELARCIQSNAAEDRVIITTIQKLGTYAKSAEVDNSHYYVVYDEAHRSSMGLNFYQLKKTMPNVELFGLTGTPVLESSATNGVTTANVFGEVAHSYLMQDAMDDGNILAFDVIQTEVKAHGSQPTAPVSSKLYTAHVSKDILKKHVEFQSKHRGVILPSFVVCRDIDQAVDFYKELTKQSAQEYANSDIFVSTLYSSKTENRSMQRDAKKKDCYEEAIDSHNARYGTAFKHSQVNEYSADVQSRLKQKQFRGRKPINIVVVVGMLMTGFDSEYVESIFFVDKLTDATLVQAMFRAARRSEVESKRYARICIYQDGMREEIDTALTKFNNDQDASAVLADPMPQRIESLREKLAEARSLAPDYEDILTFSEEQKIEFVKTWNAVHHISKNIFEPLEELDLGFTQGEYDDYNSMWIDVSSQLKERYDNLDEDEVDQKFLEEITIIVIEHAGTKVDGNYIRYLMKRLGRLPIEEQQEKVREIKKSAEEMPVSNAGSSKYDDLTIDGATKKFILENIDSIVDFGDIDRLRAEHHANLIADRKVAICAGYGYDSEILDRQLADFSRTKRITKDDILPHLAVKSAAPRIAAANDIIDFIKSSQS